MYVRPPNSTTEKIKVPENYRGNAFGSSGEYTDMPPPIRIPRSDYDLPPEEYRERRNIPEGEEAFEDHRENINGSQKLPAVAESKSVEPHVSATNTQPSYSATHTSDDTARNPIFSSLLPPLNNSAHFPFGHGIGAEELLILGIMLLIFTHEGESREDDNELILLLALLLFAG